MFDCAKFVLLRLNSTECSGGGLQKLVDFCMGRFLLLLIRLGFDLPGMTPGSLAFKASFENGLYCRTLGIPVYRTNLCEKQQQGILARNRLRDKERREHEIWNRCKICIRFEWCFSLPVFSHIIYASAVEENSN